MAPETDATLAVDTDESVRAVLRETLELLRAALVSILGDDDADDYGMTNAASDH